MQCNFVVGQKVVCIAPRWDGALAGPSQNEIVTIAAMEPFADSEIDVILSLREYSGAWFSFRGFRPLRERPKETSIEIFRKLLDPTPADWEELYETEAASSGSPIRYWRLLNNGKPIHE